jgi:hypothetical protein
VKLLIAHPTYGSSGSVSMMAQLLLNQRHPDWNISHLEIGASCLAWCFNQAWCMALNLRAIGEITHFLLIHSDVRPRDATWFDTLLGEMVEHRADVMSAIIPIKNEEGLTSTALDTDPWQPMRLTQKQIHKYPRTWSAPELLFNTGLLLIDMSGDWVEKAFFTINDKIERDEKTGLWKAYVQPEDWNFSRQCRALGVRAFVTRAVTVDHYGTSHWPSDRIWGKDADA